MSDEREPPTEEQKERIRNAPHITFTIPLQVLLEKDYFEARNHLQVHLVRDEVLQATAATFDKEVEIIRQELNEADPMTIRPPFEFNSRRLIDVSGAPHLALVKDNGEEH